ncbi:PEP-CTERM sorting domain-containing protein [Edaphobacter acidisoli]|nr:PEP-CTERM sorting domain-containing protein [Edaphobacter acidisoli]
MPALVSLCLQPPTAHADSLTLSAEFLGNSTVLCSSNANPASCTGAQASGSSATGTVGAAAQFPPGGLPLPSFTGQTTDEAIASAALLYNFTSSVQSGTAVIDLSVTGNASVSTTGMPSSICPASTPCKAVAEVGIASGESFNGAPSGTTEDVLANISNSGSASAPSGPIQIVVPISGGIADLSFNLTTLAECPALTALQISGGISCTAIANYLDPLTITGASVYDVNGNLVSNATLISDTGYSPPASVPEPSSMFLLGTGIPLLGLTTQILRGRRSRDTDIQS